MTNKTIHKYTCRLRKRKRIQTSGGYHGLEDQQQPGLTCKSSPSYPCPQYSATVPNYQALAVAPSTSGQLSVMPPSTPVQMSEVSPSTPVQVSVVSPSTAAQLSVVSPSTSVQMPGVSLSTPAQFSVVSPPTSAQPVTMAPVVVSPAQPNFHQVHIELASIQFCRR